MRRVLEPVAGIFFGGLLFLLVTAGFAEESERGWLGVYVEPVPRKLQKKYHLDKREGVYIRGVVKDSPADFADLEEDDIILALDGKKIRSPAHLQRLLRKRKPGDTVKLKVIHDGRRKEIKVTLEEIPHRWRTERKLRFPKMIVWGGSRAYLGVHLQELNEDLARYFRVEPESGVLITDVEEGSPADEAGLKAGDILVAIDGEEVFDPKDVKDILQEYEEGDEVELTVLRSGKEVKLRAVLEEYDKPVLIPYDWPFFYYFNDNSFRWEWDSDLDFWMENLHNNMNRLKRELRRYFREVWPWRKDCREIRIVWDRKASI